MKRKRNNSKLLPTFQTLDELIKFFDANDLGDYELQEVQCGVDIKRRTYWVAVEAELAHQLVQIARSQRTSFEKLIDSWLREKIQESERSTGTLKRRTS